MDKASFEKRPDQIWIRRFDRLLRHVRSPIERTICALILASLFVVPARAADATANKEVVLAYYDAAFNHKDFEKAVHFLSPNYKQHRPNAADGPEGLRKIVEYLQEKSPQSHGEIKHVIAEGDFVALHILFKRDPEGRGEAISDFYRLENGKIAEHWDVSQDIPEKNTNPNGMF